MGVPCPSNFGCLYLLGFGLKEFLQHNHNIFFPFGDLEACVLTQTMEKDNRIQDFSADDAVPAIEDAINVIKLFKIHSAATPLTAGNLFSFIQIRCG